MQAANNYFKVFNSSKNQGTANSSYKPLHPTEWPSSINVTTNAAETIENGSLVHCC